MIVSALYASTGWDWIKRLFWTPRIYSSIPLLRYSSTPLLIYSANTLLLYSFIPLFIYSSTYLLLYSYSPLLHYSSPLLLYYSTPLNNVNTRRMSQPDMDSIFTKTIFEILWSKETIICFIAPRILDEHCRCIYLYLQIQPRENWFQYVRRVYAIAINFPCIRTLLQSK